MRRVACRIGLRAGLPPVPMLNVGAPATAGFCAWAPKLNIPVGTAAALFCPKAKELDAETEGCDAGAAAPPPPPKLNIPGTLGAAAGVADGPPNLNAPPALPSPAAAATPALEVPEKLKPLDAGAGALLCPKEKVEFDLLSPNGVAAVGGFPVVDPPPKANGDALPPVFVPVDAAVPKANVEDF